MCAQNFELDGPATSYGCYDGYETEIRVFQSLVVVLQPPGDKIRNLFTKPTCISYFRSYCLFELISGLIGLTAVFELISGLIVLI